MRVALTDGCKVPRVIFRLAGLVLLLCTLLTLLACGRTPRPMPILTAMPMPMPTIGIGAVGGRVPCGAEAEYAYRAGYDSNGRVSVNRLVDERGCSAMLKQPRTNG